MSAVWMRHPYLPDDQLIAVDPGVVPGHRAAGWVETDAPPEPPKSETEEAPEVGASVSVPASEKPRRRAAPKEGEEK